jgi:hypothetical protein
MDIENNKIKHPFKTPEDYFTGLEDAILAQTKIDSIQKIEFKVKADYFDNLEKTILNKTVGNFNVEKPTFRIWKNNAFKYAASLFLILSMSVLAYFNLKTDPIENLSSDEISAYLESENEQGKEFQMALEEINIDNPDLNTTNLESLNSEEINAYLN